MTPAADAATGAGTPEAAAAGADGPGPRGPGWLMVARKELADHLDSARLLIVVLLLGLAGVVAVYTVTSGLRGAATEASRTPSLFLRMFTFTPEAIPFSFLRFVGLLGPLLGIAFGFDAINAERSARTLPRLVAQPIHRDDVINGKFVAGLAVIATVLAALMLIVAGLGIVRLGIVPGAGDVVRLLGYLVVTVVYIAFWLALAVLCSVLLERAATSAMTALGAWLVLALFGGLVAGIAADVIAPAGAQAAPQQVIANARLETWLARLSPSTLYQEATRALLTPELSTFGVVLRSQTVGYVPSPLTVNQSLLLIWPQTVGLVALTVVAFAVGYVRFLREEIRA